MATMTTLDQVSHNLVYIILSYDLFKEANYIVIGEYKLPDSDMKEFEK